MGRQEELISLNKPYDHEHFTFTLSDGVTPYVLKFAPDGWDDDEFTLSRNMQQFGVFSKYTTSELKFVKDGRDWLIALYEADGVNAEATLTVIEYSWSRLPRTRFVGRIDFSTFKQTELSCDVQVINSTFAELMLSRMNTDVNIYGQTSIDGATISSLSATNIVRPAIKLNQFCNWTSGTGTITKTASHVLPTSIEASEYEEAEPSSDVSPYFFLDASQDYAGATVTTDIKAIAHGNDANAYFSWTFKLERYSGGLLTETIWSENVICQGLNTNILISKVQAVDLLEGESLKIHAVYTPSIGTGNIVYDAFEGIKYKFTWLMADYPVSSLYGMLYHEAFERLVYIYTGISGRFKSDFFGRTDIGYDTDGIIGAIATGRDFNGVNFWNQLLSTSFDKLFKSLQAIYGLGVGIEIIDGVEKVVIEPIEYFFDNNVTLNVSERIAEETIEREYYPEVVANRISVGYNSFEYKSLGGVYEFNTTSKYSTAIKPVDKELNIISPIRADMSGIVNCLALGGTNYDDKSLEEVFIFDTIRDGGSYIVRTDEGFDEIINVSNRDTLFNVSITPARNVRRWGKYLRGFLDKYITSKLVFQASDKNTQLHSTETGEAEIIESANIVVSTLADPIWLPEIVTFEVPQLWQDLDVIMNRTSGLVKYGTLDYGWILTYKAKNENGKSEFTLLRCNLDYVTPIGDVEIPTALRIGKTVIGNPPTNEIFYISIVGDNSVEYLNIPITVNESIVIENIPYGTYTITEATKSNYVLNSITPDEVTFDINNLQQTVIIENEYVEVINIIEEDGDFIITEDGNNIIME